MLYNIIIWLHSYGRWFVLAGAVWALYQAYTGLSRQRSWGTNDSRASAFFVNATSAQFVLGLLLYVWPGGTTMASLGNMASTMRDSTLRFFAVEHVFGMLIAVALVHVGAARARRAKGKAKFRQAAIFFTLATVVMLASIPWWRPLLRGLGV